MANTDSGSLHYHSYEWKLTLLCHDIAVSTQQDPCIYVAETNNAMASPHVGQFAEMFVYYLKTNRL